MVNAETIRKAIVQSQELHGAATSSDLLAMNQMVRWINVKEEHADKIIKLVGEYCLCQRVKKDVFKNDEDFVIALKCHHAVMQGAMKCKQSMDTTVVDSLDSAIEEMSKMYLP
jgi:hypothetical protein